MIQYDDINERMTSMCLGDEYYTKAIQYLTGISIVKWLPLINISHAVFADCDMVGVPITTFGKHIVTLKGHNTTVLVVIIIFILFGVLLTTLDRSCRNWLSYLTATWW